MYPQTVIFYLWDAWMVSWFLAAFWSARAMRRPAFGSEALHLTVTLTGIALLLGVRAPLHAGHGRLYEVSEPVGWVFVAVSALGFAFCWWARLYLGRLWSGSVTRKADHHIVDTGPYAIVRHPIYTGIIAAAFATAVMRGTIAGLVGAPLIALGFWIKARLEERFLSEELGAEAYEAYRRRVPMLAPFGPRST